jgi:hypothetical protein
LRRNQTHGIDVTTTADAALLEATDPEHISHALAGPQRVIVLPSCLLESKPSSYRDLGLEDSETGQQEAVLQQVLDTKDTKGHAMRTGKDAASIA